MHRALGLIASFLPFSLALASPAAAQDHPVPSPQRATEAGAHFDRGSSLYLEGDYAAAIVEFKRAYDASPRWQVLFNIGQCYFQLRDYANAFTTLQRFASEGGDRIEREDRATLDAELPELANRVARVSVSSNLDGAAVSIDDQMIGTTPLSNPILVSIGMRRLAATHEGRAPVQQRLAVGAGDSVTVHLDFAPPASPEPPTPPTPVPVPAPVPAPALAPPPDQPARHGPNYVPVYVSLAVAAGGAVVGSIFGGLAIGDKSSLDRVCTPSGACPASAGATIQDLSRDGSISTVGFGVALAGLASGVFLWLTARSPPATPAAVRFDPTGITGRF